MTPPPPDSVAQFAADLRALRLSAGNPTLEALAIRSGRGRTALSKAFRGNALPTKKTLTAIVKVLDGDVDAWVKRWALVRLEAVESSSNNRLGGQAHHVVSLAAFGWVIALVGVVSLAMGVGIGIASARIGTSPSASPQSVSVTPGDDPWAEAACQDDATRVGFGTRANNYLVEVFWSPACNAMWGQITRFDGAIDNNSLTASVAVGFQPDTTQTITATDVQAVHTPLLLSPGRTGTVCVTGTVQVGADQIDLSPPLCTDGR